MNFNIQFKSIKTKILVSLAMILIVVCAGLGIIASLIASSGVKATVNESLAKISEQAADQVNLNLQIYYSELNALASNEDFLDINANKAVITAILQKEAKHKNHQDMLVSDQNGMAYTMTGKKINIAEREYFKKAMQGNNAISDPLVSKIDNSIVMVVAAPLKNSNGQVIGIIAAIRDGNELSNIIANTTFAKSGKAFIINSEGVKIAHSNHDLVLKMDNDFENVKTDSSLANLVELEKQMVAGKKGFGEYQYNGIIKYMGYHPIEGTDWSVALAAPKAEVFTAIDKLNWSILIVSLLFFLISLGAGLMIASSISKPVKKVAGMIKEMSQGHLGGRLDLTAKDEIGQMALAMDSFADNLQNVVIGTMKQIAAGDVSANIVIKDNQDEIAPALKITIEAIREMVTDANLLSQAAFEGKLDIRADASKHRGDFKKIIDGVNQTLDSVVGPLNVAAEYMDRISKGDIPVKITDNYRGDFNEIKNNLNVCIDSVNALVEDAAMLASAAVDGKLDARADAERHGGDFKKIIDGVNNTLDAVIGPLNVAAEYVDRISKGDIPAKITDDYHGDFNEIKNNLNTCIDAVNLLVQDADTLVAAAVAGQLDTRADADKHSGDFKRIIDGVNQTLDAVIGPLNVAAEYVDRISKGDIPPKITDAYHGDFNEIKNNLNQCIDAVNALVEDAASLSAAAVDGKLDSRADAGRHGGDFRKIVQGVNDTLDAVIGPLNVAAEYVDRISKGDIPPKITDTYHGDFNEIKNNLNQCIDAVNALVEDAASLSAAAVDGKLDSRADAGRHGGDFRKIVEGVNNTLDAVIGPLNVAAEYVDRISKGDIPPKITDTYHGDFNEIKNNLNTCIDAVNALVEDAAMLAGAAVAGKLDTRADAGRHGGDFRKIVEGVNNTLDAVIGPLNVAAEYVDRISKGDIPVKITDTYHGDFNGIKNNLNQCIDAVKALVADAAMLAAAAVAGKLDTRADAAKHGGDFRKIVDGVNHTLDAVIDPLNVAAHYVDRISKGDIPEKITDSYNGDFNIIKNNLNNCIDGLGGLVEVNQVLQAMAVNDHTMTVQVSYAGVFAEVGHAVNEVRERMLHITETANKIAKGDIGDLIVYKAIGGGQGRRSEKDQLVPSFIMMMEAIKTMIDDVAVLSEAAVAGKLGTRADAGKHSGDFRKIVQGVNTTLDAVIEPITEAAAVLKEMALGNLQTHMVGDYQGDHAEIKVALNETLDSLATYVGEISQVLTEMANSNLDVAIVRDYKGDFSSIKEALNLIIASFNHVLTDFNNTADQVATGSRQVSEGSQALSQGATEQASSIEQLTASINEIASQTRQNAVNANEANGLAATAQTNAVQGNSQMKEMLVAMEEINISSTNISKIIKVIDEIAFQTNILALNAAVEAARAGQHGKGFAVVAEEVRNLAARSASAAKETTGLIEGSIGKVAAGTKIANNTAGALDRIVSDVAKAAALVGSIAVASNEQATGIAQINQGVEQVAQVVQTNSATAEESAAASEELSSQAELLKEMINAFSLKKDSGVPGRAQAAEMLNPGKADRKKSSPRIALSNMEFGKY